MPNVPVNPPLIYRATTGLKVRKTPPASLTQDNRVYTLEAGDDVQVVAMTGDGYWYKIKTTSRVDGTPVEGWSSHKGLASVAGINQIQPGDPPYMRIAFEEWGTKGFVGQNNNERVLRYLRTTNLGPKYVVDETFWCSAFVNWSIEKVGMAGTGSAAAVSWKGWANRVEPADVRRGDIVVFKRPDPVNPNGGHVGFFIDRNNAGVSVLGGNQGNAVNISRYGYKVLGYRRP